MQRALTKQARRRSSHALTSPFTTVKVSGRFCTHGVVAAIRRCARALGTRRAGGRKKGKAKKTWQTQRTDPFSVLYVRSASVYFCSICVDCKCVLKIIGARMCRQVRTYRLLLLGALRPRAGHILGGLAGQRPRVEDELLSAGHRKVVDIEDAAVRLVRHDWVLGVDFAGKREV